MTTYIIAEAGVNHNGDMAIAKRLVEEAKFAGADCIKFQTFITENLVTKYASKAEYQKKQTNSNQNQWDMLKKLELSFENFIELKQYCEVIKIDFLSTPFDMESIDFLNSLGMRTWKIPSGDITNFPLLVKIAALRQNIILSTGMSTLEEVRQAVEVIKEYGTENITLLHCTTEYPAPYNEVNLSVMKTLEENFNLPIGYSDHTNGIEVAIAAVAMGATVIEKHFTLNRNMEGPDHKASLEPNELQNMIQAIRHIEEAIGNGIKLPTKSEQKNINIARKSITAKVSIMKGEMFTVDNLAIKRPGNGINPMSWNSVIGAIAKKDFAEDELIEL